MNSLLFEFCVGPEKKNFTIHSGALLPLSPYFVSLINGEMREAQERRVVWDDIDEQTFLIFSQFAYRGDYKVPESPPDYPKPREDEDITIKRARLRFAHFWYSKKTVNDWSRDCAGRDIQYDRGEMSMSKAVLTQLLGWSPGEFSQWKENKNVSASSLIVHAKAYVLADRYCVTFFKDMALKKLHRKLVTSYFTFEAVDYVSELIRYAWTNTRSEESSEPCSLRRLLVLFGAFTFNCFITVPSFKAVLHDYGDFATAILEVLSGE